MELIQDHEAWEKRVLETMEAVCEACFTEQEKHADTGGPPLICEALTRVTGTLMGASIENVAMLHSSIQMIVTMLVRSINASSQFGVKLEMIPVEVQVEDADGRTVN